MNTVVIAVLSIGLFAIGYRIYGERLAKIYGVDPKNVTPAHKQFDGVDYVPAKHWTILFGHHFASISGAAPIIGPVIAVSIWGWGPAILWIVLGTIFIGGVHDFGALMVSIRHNGSTVAEVAESVVSKRAKVIFTLFVLLALILVIAVFIYFCAKTLTADPRTVLPSLGLIPIAILVGHLMYNKKKRQRSATLIGLGLLVVMAIAGNFIPVSLGSNSQFLWSVLLLIYCYAASIAPVQLLLQPRDYLSSFLLLAGLVFGYLGIILSNAPAHIPAVTGWGTAKHPLWPMLFVTVACGAISGFHSLIASGTTSKQISSEADARKIGYGGMVAEGLVSTMALLCIVAGIANKDTLTGLLSAGGPGPIGAFGIGFGNLTKIFLGGFGGLIAVMILNAFILTTLDSATRIGRYLTQELFGIKNRYVSTFLVVLVSGWLGLSGKWLLLWPVFGAANQLVAGISLMIIGCWLLAKKGSARYALIPAVLMLITAIGALLFQMIGCLRTGEQLLALISALLLGLAIFVVLEILGRYKTKLIRNF
ncbi:MAG: carbon starvation protein A [Candidatus Omnitrophica bacterium]|nr:carbon starvation protein A [Candidatus Omnitrophota bacterium]